MNKSCAISILWLLVCGCGEKQNPGTGHGGVSGTGQGSVTYADPIQGLLEARCTGCHASTRSGSDRNGAPLQIDLDSYAEASKNADRANRMIQSGAMPPAGPLPVTEKQSFQAWLDQGLPQ